MATVTSSKFSIITKYLHTCIAVASSLTVDPSSLWCPCTSEILEVAPDQEFIGKVFLEAYTQAYIGFKHNVESVDL